MHLSEAVTAEQKAVSHPGWTKAQKNPSHGAVNRQHPPEGAVDGLRFLSFCHVLQKYWFPELLVSLPPCLAELLSVSQRAAACLCAARTTVR